MTKNFALIGVAGYVAPRHLKAIHETGHRLLAALDRNDSVGVIDGFFPQANFFTEFERFDRHIEKLRRLEPEKRIHYVSIASPNYLHDAHIRFALRVGADAICEKPLVINPWNIDALKVMETETGRTINAILQTRLHPAMSGLHQRVRQKKPGSKFDIDLTYITARGRWYYVSWKGDMAKSGGIATNIGIHFFDMLIWIFGPVQKNIVHHNDASRAAGFLELANARIRWFLSLEESDLPVAALQANKRSHRQLVMNSENVEFSDGFTDLHTANYREILAGRGFGLEDARPAIQAVYDIRQAVPQGKKGDYHPLLGAMKR